MDTVKRRHCAGIKTTMMYGDNTISWLSGKKEISNTKGRSHSSVRSNDGETSKYNNQQGIHNHCTCQYNAGGYYHLRGGVVALSRGEAAIDPWRRLHFMKFLPLPILSSFRKSQSGICHYCQAVSKWTTTWPSTATTRWTPDSAGVTTFWRYHCGAIV